MTVLTYIANSLFFKWIYGFTFTMQTVALMQESLVTESSFLETLLNNAPAQLLYVLSIVYAFILIATKLSDGWKRHEVNKLEVKMKKEDLESKEIGNEQKRHELH